MAAAAEVEQVIAATGYAIVPGLLSGAEVSAARDQLSELAEAVGWGTGFDGTRTRRVWAPLAVTRCMDAAALNPLVLDVVERLIGPGAQFGNTVAIQVHPGQDAQVLHYEQGIYPLPRDRDVMISALWALDDFTADNGATRVVPGSHQESAGKPDPTATVPAVMPAGSVLLFSGRLYHGGGANNSGRTRLGVVIDYLQPWLRPCEAHALSALAADPAEVRRLPPRLQELLGFNQASRYLGFVNGQHPREWLMNTNG